MKEYHSVVDALCSGITVIMTRKQFIQFGLGKLGFGYRSEPDIYVSVTPDPRIKEITQSEINTRILRVVMDYG